MPTVLVQSAGGVAMPQERIGPGHGLCNDAMGPLLRGKLHISRVEYKRARRVPHDCDTEKYNAAT